MGFRNIYVFNLAMLVKQAWKFIECPDALVSRIFKARYFPNYDFLDATLGPNPSYSWRSLWSSQNLLKEGTCWCIGSGHTINVLGSPWLCGSNSFLNVNDAAAGVENLEVKDLWLPRQNVWNENLIHLLFSYDQVENIFKTPLFNSIEQDKWIWTHNSTGLYSVKSGYYLAMNTLVDSSHLKSEGEWNLIWNLHAPPRVKLLLWRVCRNALPSHEQLRARNVNCSSLCIRCEAVLENSWHLFITCPVSVACWTRFGLKDQVINAMHGVHCFKDLCFKMLKNLDSNSSSLFASVIWSIWHSRNA